MKKVIKKTKEKMKNNKELLLGLIVGLLISSAGVYAVEGYLYESDEVSYNDSKVNTVTLGADTVQGALDELNTRIEANCMKKTVTVQVVNGSVTGESTKQIKTGTQGTFTVSPNSGYGNGTVSCTNSQTATISGTTLTTGAITNDTTCTVTFTATASWHYSYYFSYASSCRFGCKDKCSNNYGSSVWSCTTSRSTAPSSASLTSGYYCWCQY